MKYLKNRSLHVSTAVVILSAVWFYVVFIGLGLKENPQVYPEHAYNPPLRHSVIIMMQCFSVLVFMLPMILLLDKAERMERSWIKIILFFGVYLLLAGSIIYSSVYDTTGSDQGYLNVVQYILKPLILIPGIVSWVVGGIAFFYIRFEKQPSNNSAFG